MDVLISMFASGEVEYQLSDAIFNQKLGINIASLCQLGTSTFSCHEIVTHLQTCYECIQILLVAESYAIPFSGRKLSGRCYVQGH